MNDDTFSVIYSCNEDYLDGPGNKNTNTSMAGQIPEDSLLFQYYKMIIIIKTNKQRNKKRGNNSSPDI